MKHDIIVPPAGESVTSGVLAAWLKDDGAAVSEGEDVFEFETEKATLAVPALASGVLKQSVAVGADVLIGQVVGVIDTDAAAASKSETPAPPAENDSAAADSQLSPAVRKILQENNLEATAISGTGKGGRLTKKDVEQVLEAAKSAASAPAAAPTPTPAPAPAAAKATPPPPPPPMPRTQGDRSQTRQPMSSIRRTIAANLVRSQRDAAHLTTFNEVDMTAARDMRKEFGEGFEKKYGVRLGYMSFFVKAVCHALQEFPDVNAMIDGTDLIRNSFYDIGIAVSTERGLVVPVLRDADQMSFGAVEYQIREYAGKARDKKLTPDEMSGGTFTITNGGVFGSLLSTPIPTPPQTAVLGMHTIQKRPMVINDEIVIRDMMYLALTYDHRIIDGKAAVTFLVRIKQLIEDPRAMLLDV